MTKVFIHQKLQIQSVQSWLKICKCKLSLVICCYSCYYFIIGLIDMQRFWALSYHLQYADGGRNSGDSLISQLYFPSLSFPFSFHIDLLALLLRGFFAHFPTLLSTTGCVLDTVNAFSPVFFLLLPSYFHPLYPVCRRTFWTLSLSFHKSLLVHFFQAALRDIYHPVPSLTECPF